MNKETQSISESQKRTVYKRFHSPQVKSHRVKRFTKPIKSLKILVP